ncbi:hypothetical protein [Nocardia fluminea]|uniref:hypothetical protein n=1 Tax=Nocardia fluminea TaxID=134984 RepID=UPI0033C305D2
MTKFECELTSDIARQIMGAHRKMERAGITLSDNKDDYAEYFWEMEDAMTFRPGYVDCPDRKVLIYLYEAMCALCAVNHADVLKLLKLAITDLEPRSAGNVGNALFGGVA